MEKCVFPSIGYDRLRIATDGEGVTTLVCAAGCPLRCKYCLNTQSSHERTKSIRVYTPRELYELVKIDSLYFLATGGGVTFGGGEPLCYSGFIAEFSSIVEDWKINVETSLWVNKRMIRIAAEVVDTFFVDIKDMDPYIYKTYTGRDVHRLYDNLELLSDIFPAERVVIRLPLIEGCNSDADRDRSEEKLRALGFTRFDRFDYIVK